MKNIFKKTLFLLASITLLAACSNNSAPAEPEPEKEEPSLEIDVESVELEQFDSLLLTYTLLNSKEEVRWASSDSSIVSVTEEGVIYGVRVGSAYINATAGDLVSSCTVNVVASSSAPTLVYDTDEIKIATESEFEQDLYVKFKEQKVSAEINLSIKNGAETGLIDFSYDLEEGRLLISSKQNTGSTTLVAGIEIYGSILVHEFVITII